MEIYGNNGINGQFIEMFLVVRTMIQVRPWKRSMLTCEIYVCSTYLRKYMKLLFTKFKDKLNI